MHNFLFECPALGLMVQGTIEGPPAAPEEGQRILYQCPACSRMHLVDPWAPQPADRSKEGEP
jgi:hypothetical protein